MVELRWRKKKEYKWVLQGILIGKKVPAMLYTKGAY